MLSVSATPKAPPASTLSRASRASRRPETSWASGVRPGAGASALCLAWVHQQVRRRGAGPLRALKPGDYGLPPKLAGMASALAGLPNDRMRYQQLMALAAKLPAMPAELKLPENKVPGCLSTVHVSAQLEEDGTVSFQGDSDALISKGLCALLVLCLSGCTPEEIAGVKPEFIKASGISAALTPGRNNGFFNMPWPKSASEDTNVCFEAIISSPKSGPAQQGRQKGP
ncbi:unnamed protein product [Symbiodinium sp. CCMP2592]|nr:unnamed protein product [Symbiodinium sp. CCMP2592]